MNKKSFPIEDRDLDLARESAKALGISLNKYLLSAVREKNAGTYGADQLIEVKREIQKMTQLFEAEITRARIQIIEDGQRSLEAMKEKLDEHLDEDRAQFFKFVRAVGEQFSAVTRSSSPKAFAEGVAERPTKPPQKPTGNAGGSSDLPNPYK